MSFRTFFNAAIVGLLPQMALAQAFFVPPGIDPATGVDRGSTAQISAVDEPTRFFTLDTTGAEAIGRVITSLSFALPDVVSDGDQLDIAGVVGGPSDTGGRELLAAGIGYRRDVADGLTIFVNADHGDYILGTADTLPLDVRGAVTNLTFGVTREWSRNPLHRVRATLALGGRDESGSFIGGPTTDESIRFIRLTYRNDMGIPFSFARRFSLGLTKGLDGFGATGSTNPLASAPGSDPDFLKMSAAAEVSLPIGANVLLNTGVIAQWSDDSLPVSQRCGYGTNSYARGFDRSYVNGDRCLGGRVELAYNILQPDFRSPDISATQAFAGVDAGRVWDNSNAVLPAASDDWSSFSAGLRILKGDILGEIQATRILDQPAGAFVQSRNRLWVRFGVRF